MSLFIRHPPPFSASDLVNHWAPIGGSLWLMPTSFSFIPAGGWGWGGYYFVFCTPNNNRKCSWALFPIWHQYRFRTVLFRCSSCAAELASLCLGLGTMRAAYLSGVTQLKNLRPASSCLQSPSPLLSRPITNSLLRYNDIEFWQLRVFLLSLNFFSPLFLFHLSFSFSPSIFEGL